MSVAAVEPTGSQQMSDSAKPLPQKPSLPALTEVPAEEGRRVLRMVRQFHLSGLGDGLGLPGADDLPVLLHGFRDAQRVRSDYPLLLLPHGQERAAMPLGEWLAAAIERCAATLGDVKMLADNLAGLELRFRSVARDTSNAGPLLVDSAAKLSQSLSLRERDADQLRADVTAIAGELPEGTRCLTLGEHAGVVLMAHLMQRHGDNARAVFASRAGELRTRLIQLLEEDQTRDEQAAAANASGRFDQGGGGIDPAALARVLSSKRRGGTAMPPARRERIASAADTLENYLESANTDRHVLVHAGELDGVDGLPDAVELVRADLPCAEGARRFDELAERFTGVALSVRIGELELSGSYDESVYGPLIESFGRESLSAGELSLLPCVACVETVERLTGADMPNFTRVLLSGRPIRVLLEVEPAANISPQTTRDALSGFRFEPGLFGMSHRTALVHHTAASRWDHLLGGLDSALGSPNGSLHVIATGRCEGGQACTIGTQLHAGAAGEGRAHPLYCYDPRSGRSWAERFDFDGNEQPEQDWPRHELACTDSGGGENTLDLAFSFADFAILEPTYRDHFRVIPDSCPTNDLTPIDQYPIDDASHSDRLVPFVWAAGELGRMRRLVVSRRLLDSCRDRLGAWRMLQQRAGIHDVYAERAIEAIRTTSKTETDARIQELIDEHAGELEQARAQAGGEAMERLAQMLLQLDPAQFAAGAIPPAAAPPTAAPATEPVEDVAGEPEPVAPVEEDDDPGFDEPYIDSPLCTACNDCMDLNPQLFVYNANKQAEIGDPNGGTFAQLVQAAEACPAKCIHPGKPLNADEPDLSELIERAKPFN